MHNLSDGNILVVDDTEANVDVLVETLGQDYELMVAMDGPAALDTVANALAEGQPPDLILLDIMMSGMDGYEVCERLKGDPQSREIYR